jgi:hypothetical protein
MYKPESLCVLCVRACERVGILYSSFKLPNGKLISLPNPIIPRSASILRSDSSGPSSDNLRRVDSIQSVDSNNELRESDDPIEPIDGIKGKKARVTVTYYNSHSGSTIAIPKLNIKKQPYKIPFALNISISDHNIIEYNEPSDNVLSIISKRNIHCFTLTIDDISSTIRCYRNYNDVYTVVCYDANDDTRWHILINTYGGIYMMFNESKKANKALEEDYKYLCRAGELIPAEFDVFNKLDLAYVIMVEQMEDIINMSDTSRVRMYNDSEMTPRSGRPEFIKLVNASSGSYIRTRSDDIPGLETTGRILSQCMLKAQYMEDNEEISPRITKKSFLRRLLFPIRLMKSVKLAKIRISKKSIDTTIQQ